MREARPQVLLFPDVPTGTKLDLFRAVAREVQSLGVAARVLDLTDESARQSALRLRSFYDVGRNASVVLINEDGAVLREWCEPKLPDVQELMGAVVRYAELHSKYWAVHQ